MRHIIFEESEQYPIAILIKATSFNRQELEHNYVDFLNENGISSSDLIGFTLDYDKNGKAPVKLIKSYLKEELLPVLKNLNTQYLYCADSAYFKVLTGSRTAKPHFGYVLPCVIEGYEHFNVILGLNHKVTMYDPGSQPQLDMSLNTLLSAYQGNGNLLGKNVIQYSYYPETYQEIAEALYSLHQYPELSCDIETASLDFHKAGIATIAFAWNQHEGIAFAVDYETLKVSAKDGRRGVMRPSKVIRQMLRRFFSSYKGRIRWHKANFDLDVLIYSLWMKNLLDNEGMLKGLEIMTRRFDDTRIVAYLATNTTAENNLSLKDLAHPHAGDWAQEEISNVLKIPLPELLQYNLVDAVCTNYVYDIYYPIMVQDSQEHLYESLMLPSQKTIIQMELTGMPLDPKQVARTREELESIQASHACVFKNQPLIQEFEEKLQRQAQQDANIKLKVKQHPLEAFKHVRFNPNSGPQLQQLLYDHLSLPVLDRTKTKQPATGTKTLDKLIHHSNDQSSKEILHALIGYSKVTKILTTFIPAFEQAINKGDGVVYLHGNFNLGGTVSGRLSSSDPNLQNLPSGSTYGKLIKKCFKAPRGWLFAGADFHSLEDYISALTTKDPNKLRVYLENYDGHSLRAFTYWPEKFPDIELTPESVNRIKDEYPEERQESKGPTFALTYQGTKFTLMNNLGFSEDEAKRIEANYHELYQVSDQWVQSRLDQAARDGYVDVAFGLRVRTPLLYQTLRNKRSTPYQAQAEGRTAGNAMGQSYGLLTNRAANEFMDKVRNSKYRNDVKIVAQIHDAIYLLIRDSLDVIEWVNQELIKSMEWQELPEIQHDTVKIGAELSIFYPDWSNDITLKNGIEGDAIKKHCWEVVYGEDKAEVDA
mgnify:CR=1 FL=1